MKACADCGHEGELEKSGSGEDYCSDMIACLYRPALAREVRTACSFCAHKDGLVQDGIRAYCSDRVACGVRVNARLHRAKPKHRKKP